MNRILLTYLLTAVLYNTLSAQYQHDRKRDFQWILGFDYFADIPGRDGVLFDFTTLPPITNYQSKPINFYLSNANICNQEGILQFYSNGARIIGPTHEVMENGSEIEWGTQNEALSDNTGSPQQQGVLILPDLQQDSLYHVLYVAGDLTGNEDGYNINRVYTATVDMRFNEGLGKVVSKDVLFLSDSLSFGTMNACRHANGRDWWILIPRRAGEAFWRILYDLSGFHILEKQLIPSTNSLKVGFGNTVFSPDGTHYAYTKSDKLTLPSNTILYDFDRCSGLLSNPLPLIHPTDSANVPNVAFSPNSRYLYHAFGQYVYQYDTYAADIKASRQLVAVSDGYANPIVASFMQMQLAPDGKIYVGSRSSVRLLHRIDYPDRAGVACQVCQHCIDSLVPTLWAVPAYPHFRLGPLDGSPCDTLGLDNIPWARFRFEVEPDSTGPLAVQFTDITAFEPDTWSWDFGDSFSSSNSSTERHPVHVFSSAGLYYVCMRASNDYGADSSCTKIYLSGISGTPAILLDAATSHFTAYPNPVTDQLTIVAHGDVLAAGTTVRLYNMLGVLVATERVANATTILPTAKLPAGAYRLVVYEGQQAVHTQLIVKQ